MRIAKELLSKISSGKGTASQAAGDSSFVSGHRFSDAVCCYLSAPSGAADGIVRMVPLLLAIMLCTSLACSPRDILIRRLAADLISASEPFKTPQVFWLKTGIVSNRDFNSPDSMVLRHRGWTIGTQRNCPRGVDPPPCWEVLLSPLGVDTFRPLISDSSPGIGPVSLPVARRQLVNIAGISKAGTFADVEFTWRWVPLNSVGAALYDEGVQYRSTVGFRSYDDGWRIVNETVPRNQSLEEALHNAEPTAP
jgi:hypothetical protein